METNLTYNIATQTIHDLKALSGGSPSPAKQKTKHRPDFNSKSDCRIIASLINHHTGTPLGSVDTALDGLLPSERAILIVGLSGVRRSGEPIKRAALYGYRDGNAQLRFPINFNHITGDPIFNGENLPREAELAAINWMQGAMFNPNLAEGIYDFNARAISEEMPLRREFASERRVESSVEMFNRYLGLQAPMNSLVLPGVIPLLLPGQLPVGVNPLSLKVREFAMESSCFRAHAVDRFVLGLHSASGNGFKELKRAFIKQFDIADETIAATQNDSERGMKTLLQVCAEQTGIGADSDPSAHRGILKFAEIYLSGLNLGPENTKKAGTITYQAIRMLENYFLNRTPDGKVLAFAPKQDSTVDEDLFRKPASYTVSGSPLVIIDQYQSSGMFPYLAGDLLS